MKSAKTYFVFAAMLVSLSSLGQTEVGTKIWIPSGDSVIKIVKVAVSEDLPVGAQIKTERVVESKKITHTITTIETVPPAGKKMIVDKLVEVDMAPDAEGWANITTDEKDKSILHINYWLNPHNEIPARRKIKTYHRVCDEKGSYSDGPPVESVLTERREVYLYKIQNKDIKTLKEKTWYKNSDLKIEVYNKDASAVEYELINRYDRNADYQLKLQNRELVSFRKKGFEYGPIVIPVKYRFERTKGNLKAKDEFQTDLNIGVYGGYRLGKYRVRYEAGSLKELSPISVSVGGFINVGATSIDSTSTTLGDIPFNKDEKASIGVFSPGFGIMLSIYNLQVGFFTGVDFGFGSSARQWNYNNRLFIGFGLAYNVGSFWKK